MPTPALDRMKKVVRPVLMAVAMAFVALAAWDLSRRWDASAFKCNWGLAVLSGAPLLLGAFMQGLGWIALVDTMTGKRVPRAPALALYLDSQLARYTPGKVGLPVVRIAGADRIGVPATTVGSSVFIEMMSWAAVGCGCGFALLYLTNEHAAGVAALLGRWGPVLVALCAVGLLALLVGDRRWIPARWVQKLGLDGSGPLMPPWLPAFQVAYFAAWAIHGALLTRAVSDVGGAPTAAGGLYVLGPVLGAVALAAPAGMGVREAVLAIGLAPVIGAAPALGGAIISRFASLAADVLAWLVMRPWRKSGARRSSIASY